MTATKTGNTPRDRQADKAAVLGSLKPGHVVEAETWHALRDQLRLGHMPITAVKRAISSLYYKDRHYPQVILTRPGGGWNNFGHRPVRVVRVAP